MLNTYCDNDALKMQIIRNRPTSEGLFLHELVMISYAEIGQVRANEPCFSSVFSELDVLYPRLLLKSMVERGYITIKRSVSNLSFYRTNELQQFAKKHGLKRPNNRAKIIAIITDSCSEEEINEELPLSFYLPTAKGYQTLRNSNFKFYLGIQDEEPIFDGEIPSEEDIVVYHPTVDGMDIVTNNDQWQYYIVVDGIKMAFFSTVWVLPKRSDIYVAKNGIKIFTFREVDVINIEYMRKKLIIRTLISPNQKTATPAQVIIFDLVNSTVEYTGFDSGSPNQRISTFDQYIHEKIKEKSSIVHDDYVFFYISLKNRIVEQIISSLESEEHESISVVPINKYLDDPTINVIVSVDIKDRKSLLLILYMQKKRLVGEISIWGLPIREIAYCLYCYDVIKTAESITVQEQFKEDVARHEDCVNLLNKLEIQDRNLYYLTTFLWRLPPEIYQYDLWQNYIPQNSFIRNYIEHHEDELKKEFESHILLLREKGIIPTKWINEFNLYLAINKVFSDCIYQFRPGWLHLQSIDIYIPSKRVGVEYQGIQHYEPVEIFGGEGQLVKQQERDRRKSNLCKENGVQLLEWKYNVEVTEENVNSFLKNNNLIL